MVSKRDMEIFGMDEEEYWRRTDDPEDTMPPCDNPECDGEYMDKYDGYYQCPKCGKIVNDEDVLEHAINMLTRT